MLLVLTLQSCSVETVLRSKLGVHFVAPHTHSAGQRSVTQIEKIIPVGMHSLIQMKSFMLTYSE